MIKSRRRRQSWMRRWRRAIDGAGFRFPPPSIVSHFVTQHGRHYGAIRDDGRLPACRCSGLRSTDGPLNWVKIPH